MGRDDDRRVETAQAELARLAMVGRLAAGVFHDLGSSLAAMCSTADLLAETEGEGTDRRRALDTLRSAARLAAQRVQGMVSLGRPTPTAPRQASVIAKTLQTAQLLASSHPIAKGLTWDMAPHLPVDTVAVSESDLLQVLLNVFLNAAQAMEGRGTLRLRAALDPTGGAFRLRIEDEGPGFSPDALERAFEAFYTSRSHRGGTGLGLTTSRSLLRAAGGDIRIGNRAEGGAWVELDLPIAPRRRA